MAHALSLRIILALIFFILPMRIFADFTPYIGGINLYGGSSPEMLFSQGSTPWVLPAHKVTMGSDFVLHGDVWTDSIGWSTFDHGVTGSEARFDSMCMNSASPTCELLGYAWSNSAGWIQFEGQGITYTKSTGILAGTAASYMVGPISIATVNFWASPITLSGPPVTPTGPFSGYTFASSSVVLTTNPLPSWVTSAGTISLRLCPVGLPAVLCRDYPYSAGGFPGVDISIATDYDYTITDPFGSVTRGTLTVYASNISTANSVIGGTLLTSYCSTEISATLCPDGSSPKTTWTDGELAQTSPSVAGIEKLADSKQAYSLGISLRDAYGNPIRPVGSPINRSIETNISMNNSSQFNSLEYNPVLYGQGIFLEYQGNTITKWVGGINYGESPSGIPYTGTRQQVNIGSYVPTKDIPGNRSSLASISATVSGIGGSTTSISSTKFQSDLLTFVPLYKVTDVTGFAAQMGRPTTISATIEKIGSTLEPTDAHIIHGLSVVTIAGLVPNLAASFEDVDISPGVDCIATTQSGGHDGYCARGNNGVGGKATIVSIPVDRSTTQVFSTTPRRRSLVELEQAYAYDSTITYKLNNRQIIYSGYTGSTSGTDKILAGAVKIIGQSSGEKIFQSIKDMYQPKTASITRSEIINEIRKNIGILTRSVVFDATNTYDRGNNFVVYKGDRLLDTTMLAKLDTKATIVVYGDITISTGYILPSGVSSPRAIIALTDANGNGGNIYIKKDVSRLDTTLVAERSLISGDPASTPKYYTDLATATGELNRQLYVYGSIISLNTIGGASIPGAATCPQSIQEECKGLVPIHYDFEHFRYYRDGVGIPAPLARGALSLSTNDKKASFIIEYDSRIVTDPPPGLSN